MKVLNAGVICTVLLSSSLLHNASSRSTGCFGAEPVVMLANGERKSSLIEMCGEHLLLQYDSIPMHEVYVSMLGHDGLYCSLGIHKEDMKDKKGAFQNVSCPMEFEVSDHQRTLKITSVVYTCIAKLAISNCISNDDEHSTDVRNKRSYLPLDKDANNSDQHSTSLQMVGIVVLTIAFSVAIVSAVVASMLSCCHEVKNDRYTKENSRTKLNPEIEQDMSTSNHSLSPMPPGSVNNKTSSFKGSWAPPSSPTIKASLSPEPEYASPFSLHILKSDKAVASSTQHYQQLRTTEHSSNSKEHLYSVLTPSSHHNGTTPLPTVGASDVDRQYYNSTNGRPAVGRGYFVLDVTLEGGAGSGPSIKRQDCIDRQHSEDTVSAGGEDVSGTVLPLSDEASRVYHVLEPLSSDTEQHCTVCNRVIQDEPDSVCLVILPEEQHSSHDTVPGPSGYYGDGDMQQNGGEGASVDAGHEPLYQVLEEPSVICQYCLYATENDPIYNEVERLPDPIYERIKMFRQDTSLSDTSHLYMSLEIPDETPPSPRKRYLREIRIASSSVDYASIPGSPVKTPVRRISIDHEEQPRHGQLAEFLNSLKRKLTQQLRNPQGGIGEKMMSVDEEEGEGEEGEGEEGKVMGDQHHIYANTGACVDPNTTLAQVQIKLDGMEKRKQRHYHTLPSPTKSINRSISHDYTPLVIDAVQIGNESYHKLNIDDIWELQQQNRYAPVSVVVRRGSKQMPKRTISLRTRKSLLKDRQKVVSEYEVPMDLRPFMDTNNLTIPPPQLIKTNQGLPRQKALKEHDGEQPNGHATYMQSPKRRMSALSSSLSNSEPCLSLGSGPDYDCLESLPASPVKAPLPLPRSPSPSKVLLERARTEPLLSPFLLYGRLESTDYDVLLSSDKAVV